MIDIDRLLERVDESLDDSSKHYATLRLLYSTARKYNKTHEELDRLKECGSGFVVFGV